MTRTEMIQRHQAYRRSAMRALAIIVGVLAVSWFCLLKVPLATESIWWRSFYEIMCFFAIPALIAFVCTYILTRRQQHLGLLCPQCRLFLYGSRCGTRVLQTGHCPRCSAEIINEAA